jgi:predicted RNA binding protein YcfA (HicA-like mRNA interferase family)
MKVSEVFKLLKKDGWFIERTKGDHRQLKHPTKRGVITLPGKMSDDIKKGTLGSILRKAGLK